MTPGYLTVFVLVFGLASWGVVPWFMLLRLYRIERCIAVLALSMELDDDDGDPPDDDPGKDCDARKSADVVAIGRRVA